MGHETTSDGGRRAGGVHGFGDLCFLVVCCVFGVQVVRRLVYSLPLVSQGFK